MTFLLTFFLSALHILNTFERYHITIPTGELLSPPKQQLDGRREYPVRTGVPEIHTPLLKKTLS